MGSPNFVRKMVPILRDEKLTFFATNVPETDMREEGLLLGAWAGDQESPVEPWRGLENGQVVRVHDAAFAPAAKRPILIEECNPKVLVSQSDACDVENAVITYAKGGGELASLFSVRTGPVGNGVCDYGQSCYLMAWQPATGVRGIAEIEFRGTSVRQPVRNSS